jgi:serine/threonine-protein kinase
MNADRNLLFGVLALQTDLIDSSQFADACAAWAARKSAGLADILIERGWITAADKADVEKLMERKLKRHGGDLQATIDAVADAGVREAMLTIEDPELRRTIVRLSSAGGHMLVDPLAKPSESHTRYTLTRLHGQGGLGRVWVARDNDLNREVALKELQEECAENPVAKSRFLKEAQITGQLEHPNIVPVYELGSRGEDQPFYTMRFLRGATLRHAISDYHKKRKVGTDDPLELRRLLSAFVGVCHALAYAHSRGVIHRDVKPSNIAMGDFGEVVLLDWGLAKIAHAEDNVSDTLGLTDGASGGETVAGRALGTPSYMSPEQAQGQLDLIGPPTDIYGLGATLFDLLTGKPPHKGETTAETLDRIIKGETPSARALNPAISPVLDAICAKAMAKAPSDRYAKAADLAEDIQRWLADEPVSCYHERLGQQAARWSRRHRAWTQAAAVALLVVAVVSTGAAVQINRARHHANFARTEEAIARAEATALFRKARAAVDTHLTGISEVLRHYPGVQRARELLLRRAAEDYEEFAQFDSKNPEIQAESAHALVRLGDVRLALGEAQLAEQSYRAAQLCFEKLAQIAPDNPALVMQHGNCRMQLGVALKVLGRYVEADEACVGAVHALDALALKHPNDPDYGDSLATAMRNRAMLLQATGQHQQAERLLEAAVRKLESLVEKHPAKPRLQFALAGSRAYLGSLLSGAGDSREGAAITRQAIESLETLSSEHPDNLDYLQWLADSRIELAKILRILGRDREEKEAYETAISDYHDLLMAVSGISDYRESLALAQTDLALLLHSLGQNPEAKGVAESALAEFRDIARASAPEGPRRDSIRLLLAFSHHTLGRIHSDLGLNSDAEVQLRTAVRTYRQLVDELSNPEYEESLATALSDLGQVLHKSEQHDAAKSCFSEAIEGFDSLDRSEDSLPQYRDGLARCHARLGDLLRDLGDQGGAKESYRKAIGSRESLATEFEQPNFLYEFATLLANCADVELRDPSKAVDIATRAAQLSPQSSTYLNMQGAALYRSGKLDDAISTLRQASELRTSGHGMDWFFLAMALWQKGELETARDYYDKGVRWMDENMSGNVELKAIQSEVAAQLQQP